MFAVVLLLQALHSASSVGLESSPPPQAEAFLQDDECQSPSNTESAQCALNALQIDRTASEEAGTQEAEYNSTSQRQGYDSINFQPDPYGQEYVIFDNRHFATKATVSVWQLRNVEIQRGYTALIKDLGRRSAWAAALSVLSEATCHDISNGTVSAALAAFHKASQWTWALQLFESMPSLKVLQDAVAHNTTAAACLKSGHWAKALSVLHKAFHGKLHPTVVTFNTAISACEKGFKWEGALNLLKALVESPNLQPNVATCTAAMSSCCRGFSWEKALAIMAAMKDPDAPLPRPDLIAYNALVSSCERASAWETALALVADLSQSLKPDVFTLGACLAACQRSRQWLLALHLVQSSQTDWAVQPDVVAYSAAISACSEGEGWEAAFRLAEQMAKDGVEQNNFTCSALIKAAEHGRQWALALEMLSRHERQFHSCFRHVLPDLVMLSSIMCACGVSYQWARTLQLLAELPRRSLRPDIVAYGVVIDACASATQWLQAVALLDDLRSARWSPNVVVYEKLFASFERSGCWEEAIALLDELCEQQLMPDANTWRAVLRACEESSMWQAAVELVAAMRRSSPNHGTCSENDMKEQGLTYDSAGSITHVGLFLIHADVASWHRDACPREHSEMALKRWAVRQLSGFLSDYLEGITEQNLQASLSLEVGEVEIRHVRVHGELLKDQHFSLLSSDVSVFARIPWRNLGSEPTVITVKDVWIEVEARAEASAKSVDPAEARAKAEEELQRWRERKRSKVEARVESARLANTEEAQPRRGMAARLGHAALRQLQVRVDGLRARVHNEVVSSTLDLSLVRLALDEGSSNPDHRTEVPAEVQRHPASLDKILELVGLCGQRTISSKDSSNLWPSLRKHDNERNFTVELKYALRFHCRHRGIMELGSSVQAPVARAHAARIDEPRGAPARGIQAATQRKRFATAIGFGISLNLAWAGQAQARSRSLRKAHGQGRHGRREVLSIGVVTPLVAPLAAKAEAEPPTVSKKVAEGVYIFDQAYGIPGLGVGANIPIRMTVLSLEGGGYLVYNPCHPTAEAMQMLKEFGLTDVRYIVCGTVAIEHKYYAPQWAQLFPKAEVWISPRTFSWPVDFGPYVPVGGFSRSTPLQKIPKDASLAPWSSKGIDHLQLTVDYAPRTVFEETVLFHKPSGSFVCTDMLIGLSDEPPEILTLSPYKEGLLWFSRDEPLEEVDVSSPKTLKDGYQKSVLLLNNINPRSLLSVAAGDLAVPEQLGLASKAPQKDLGYFGWYPCNWQASDSPCAKLDDRLLPSKGSKTFDCRPGWRGEWTRLAAGVEGTGFQVPSFVAELQVSRDPETLDSFAKEISRRWPGIKKVISSHFSSPLPASSENVSKAISAVCRGPPGPAARAADLSAILNFRDYLEENDLIYKPAKGRGSWHDLEDLQRRLETADAGILSELTEQLGRIKAALVCVQGETAPLPLGFKRCPACQLACEKQDPLSCDHITCVCGHEFCWMCGEDRRVIKAHDNSYHHKRCPFYEPCDEIPRLEKNCPVCQATGVPCLRPPQAHAARRAAIRQQALGLEVRRLREGMEQSDGAIITEKTEAVQRPEHPFNLEALSQLLCGGPLASCCRVLNSDPPARR
ncbi:Pentatricopeptide repeat-containing protein [Symbiodinium microadriaticum]|uniref:Pentatricopeptide repeat-containing protein n=1 Tax=Symbiodinium microadriaticum TaxID=2951 RepID=A0A1Q9D315_SYMMI|nr:Pentatricopeptide repeat-containing protein [Symbiodinium microadriaticum]